MTLRWLVPAVAALALTADRAAACPFCTPTGTTLTGEVAQADFILYGRYRTRSATERSHRI